MTDATMTKTPLGVGRIISETFSLFFKRFWVFFLLAFIPTLLSVALSRALTEPDAAGGGLSAGAPSVSILSFLALLVIPTAIYGLVSALIVLAAYDAKLGRPVRLQEYLRLAVSRLVPVVIVTVIVSVLVGVATLALILPGLYVAAVLAVAVVVVVLEGKGLGAMKRSAALTKGYRWPILGIWILMVVLVSILAFVSALLLGPALMSGGGLLGVIAEGTAQTIGAGLFSVAVVLVYARLREIKEGVGVDSLVLVFE